MLSLSALIQGTSVLLTYVRSQDFPRLSAGAFHSFSLWSVDRGISSSFTRRGAVVMEGPNGERGPPPPIGPLPLMGLWGI